MKKLSFNEWQDHISKQFQKDYKKLYLIPKKQKNENKFQTLSPR